MPDLEQQLRDYGAFLDGLDDLEVAPHVVAAEPGRSSRRWVAAAAVVTVLVGAGAGIAASRGGESHINVARSSGPATAQTSTVAPTTTFDTSAIASAHPTFAQQVAQLESWYANAVADAPGGRPLLLSEYELCDYRGSSLGSNRQGGFASYFPLGESLTEARLVDGCLRRDDIPRGTQAPHLLCASDTRGPAYDPNAAVVKVVTKPVVVFGNSDCTTAGYQRVTSGLLDELNNRRHIEIEIRAVPRACPTAHEAAFWASKITAQELDGDWSVVGPPPAAPTSATSLPVPPTPVHPTNCVRPDKVDWDLRQVTLERF